MIQRGSVPTAQHRDRHAREARSRESVTKSASDSGRKIISGASRFSPAVRLPTGRDPDSGDSLAPSPEGDKTGDRNNSNGSRKSREGATSPATVTRTKKDSLLRANKGRIRSHCRFVVSFGECMRHGRFTPGDLETVPSSQTVEVS